MIRQPADQQGHRSCEQARSGALTRTIIGVTFFLRRYFFLYLLLLRAQRNENANIPKTPKSRDNPENGTSSFKYD
jgi:hypothetical protein